MSDHSAPDVLGKLARVSDAEGVGSYMPGVMVKMIIIILIIIITIRIMKTIKNNEISL